MPTTTKTFADFQTLLLEADNSIAATDYLIGYRPASGTTPNQEIKISAEELFNTADDLLGLSTIRGDKIQFNPEGVDTSINNVNFKLNQFKTVDDYQYEESAGISAYNQRLFIPYGKTVVLKPNASETNALNNIFLAIKSWHIEGLVRIDLSTTSATTVTWEVNKSIDLNHPYGQNIQLVGAVANGSPRVIISMSGTSGSYDVLSCTNGNVFGLVDMISVVGLSTTGTYAGISADSGAQINLGSNVRVSNCPYGIKASKGSVIVAGLVGVTGLVRVTGCGVAGVCASSGSTVSVLNGRSDNNLGSGFLAEQNSHIICEGSYATNNTLDGYTSTSGSQINATGANASGNQGSGFLAKQTGEIECASDSARGLTTTATSNLRYGVEFDGIAKIYGDFSGMTLNSKGSISPNVTLTSTEVDGTEKNFISTNRGDLTIKTNDSGSNILFNTRDSNTHLQLLGGASPVTSYLSIKGGNNGGDIPTITATPNSANGFFGNVVDKLGIKLEGNGGYVDLGPLIKVGATLTTPGIGDPRLVPEGYFPIKINNTLVYLLVHVP